MPPTNLPHVNGDTDRRVSCAAIGEGNILLNCLKRLKEADFDIVHVFTNTSSVTTYCDEISLSHSKRNAKIEEILTGKPIEYLFSISNPRILDESVLNIPSEYAVNYHDSPLPSYAGVQSTSWAILNGEKEHGISWHIVEAGIDTGDILKSQTVSIHEEDSALSLNLKCQEAALASFATLIRDLQNQNVKRKVQDKSGRSYYGLYAIPPNLGILSFEKSTSELYNLARALEFGNHENALGSPKILSDTGEFFLITNSVPGSSEAHRDRDVLTGSILEVLDDSVCVKTGDGTIWISLAHIDGSHLSDFNFKKYGLSEGKRLATFFAAETSKVVEIRRKENFWRRTLEKYDPTVFFRQRMNVVAGIIDVSDEPNIETTDILIQNHKNVEDLEATFVSFLGRTCCTSSVSVGILANKNDIPESINGIYVDVCPTNIELDMNEPVTKVVQKCKQDLRKHRDAKTFLVDVFYRYPELRGRKQTPHHNIVIGQREISHTKRLYDQLLLHECNILVLFSSFEGKVQVLYNKRPGQDFKHIMDVLKHFPTFLTSTETSKSKPLSKVALLSKNEIERLYTRAIDISEYEAKLFDEIEKKALILGPKTALKTSKKSLSYAEMLKCIQNFSSNLEEAAQNGRRRVIGIHLSNSINYVVSLLSIMKIGHAFLPIPMDYPLERIAFTLKDSNVTTIVTTKEKQQGLSCMSTKIEVSVLNTTQIFGEEISVLRANHKTDELTCIADIPKFILPPNTLYVMYTSGSTGKPKGVSVPQNAVRNLAYAQANLWDLSEKDIIGQFASIGFDATISEIFTSLISGATLGIFSEKERLGHEFVSAINKMQINTITLPPSVLNIYGPDDMPLLQKVVTAGEACTVSTAIKWTSGTNIRFFNAYGPTETTVCATCYEFNVSMDSEEVNQELPIGKAISGAYVCLLDDFQQPVPPDVIGEIYVGGKGLSNGYVGHAEHFNETKFIQNPFCSSKMFLYKTGDHAFQDNEGNITFVGRLDDMIKIRGQRVDLAEIENIIIQHPKVEIAVVVAHKCAQSSEIAIAAYVAPTFIYLSELKEYLVKVLPRYMVPSFFTKFEKDQFPLTLNGKIDRKGLERDETVHDRMKVSTGSKSHLNEIQLAISKLWCKVLNMDERMLYTFHRQSSFSELGGNSLQLVLLQRAFQDDLGIKLSFTDIGTADTIEEFADVVRRKQDAHKKQDKNQKFNEDSLRRLIIEDSILHANDIPHHARRGSVQFQHFRSFHHKSDMRYPKNVLISGVTGFLGAYLLAEILEQTSAHVCCMVRETTEARGLGRIRENMRRYSLWKFEYSQRIAIVISDLSQPKLGIAPDIYKELTQVVDAVVMNAAQMNFNTGYEDHRIANVKSTKEFISFAMTGVQKRIFATSSLGVFLFPKQDDPSEMIYYEDDFLDDPLQIAGGYGQSKWASEKLIMQALHNLPGGAIFRPARISGCSTDGNGPKNDLFASTLVGMKRLGCYPDMDFPYDLTPVDYVAKAMIEILVKICNNNANHEKIYHLFNQNTMPFNEMFNGMGLKGYPLEEWRQKLLKAPEENKELIPLTPFFMSSFWDRSPTWPIFDTSKTDSMISNSTKRILRPSSELLEVYKKHFGF